MGFNAGPRWRKEGRGILSAGKAKRQVEGAARVPVEGVDQRIRKQVLACSDGVIWLQQSLLPPTSPTNLFIPPSTANSAGGFARNALMATHCSFSGEGQSLKSVSLRINCVRIEITASARLTEVGKAQHVMVMIDEGRQIIWKRSSPTVCDSTAYWTRCCSCDAKPKGMTHEDGSEKKVQLDDEV